MRRALEVAIGAAAAVRALAAAVSADIPTTLVWAIVAVAWSAFAFLRTQPEMEEIRARASRR